MDRKIIKVEGKWYIILGMYGGRCYLGNLFDLNNEVVKRGVIWEMQPFFYQHEFWYGKLFQKIVCSIRAVKVYFSRYNKAIKTR